MGVIMRAATLTILVIVVGMCKMKYHLIETRDDSHIKSDTGNVEYGYNYNEYYSDYQSVAWQKGECKDTDKNQWQNKGDAGTKNTFEECYQACKEYHIPAR